MAIYKNGQSQFGLHEAAMEQDLKVDQNEADFNAEVAAKNPKLFTVETLNTSHKKFGDEFPMGGTGLAKGKRRMEKKDKD